MSFASQLSNTGLPNSKWYQEDTEEPHVAAFTMLSALRNLQSARIYMGLLYEATYEQRNVFTSQWGSNGVWATGFGPYGASGEIMLLTHNQLQIEVDTIVSKLSQADVQIRFLTDGARWVERQKALQIEKLVHGEFNRLILYQMINEARLDSLLFGDGYIKFYHDEDTKRPCAERVHPLDVYYDELEARDSPPRQMLQTKLVDKDSLRAFVEQLEKNKEISSRKCADLFEDIAKAQITSDSRIYTSRGLNATECCELLEAWYLPSSSGADDGRHLVSIGTATILDTGWSRPSFPFARFSWTKMRRGPYSIGLAEQIILQQRNLNRLVQREQECIYALSAPYILVEETSQVNPSDFETAGVGNVIKYLTTRPEVIANKVVPEDVRVSKHGLMASIGQISGTTGLESTGEKPVGLNSAPAQQEYVEQSSVRFISRLKRDEQSVIQCVEQLLECVRYIKEEYGDYVAFGHYKGGVEEIKWSEVELPPDRYNIQPAPANLLPTTPAGRAQRVMDLAQAGVLTPKQAVRALASPDIAAITDDLTSSEEDIEWTIYEMTKENGRYLPPEPYQDLPEGIKKVRNAYLRERRSNAPDKILARLDQWITEAQSILSQQAQAQAQQAQQQAAQQAQQQQLAQNAQNIQQRQVELPPVAGA